MNFQKLVDELQKAGWSSLGDAQHEKIKKLWIENFPKDYVIDGLMKEIDRLTKALDEIASIYENALSTDRTIAYDMRCIAREALKN